MTSIIPKSFQIMGHTIKVTITDDLDSTDVGSYKSGIIKVRPQPDTLQGQTYCHEMVHCILQHLSYDDLDADERFVDRFAQCLFQILTTGKGNA